MQFEDVVNKLVELGFVECIHKYGVADNEKSYRIRYCDDGSNRQIHFFPKINAKPSNEYRLAFQDDVFYYWNDDATSWIETNIQDNIEELIHKYS